MSFRGQQLQLLFNRFSICQSYCTIWVTLLEPNDVGVRVRGHPNCAVLLNIYRFDLTISVLTHEIIILFREIKSSGHNCRFTSKLHTWKVFRQNFQMMIRSAEYSAKIGLSFENMRSKGPFGNNTFENCTFNFNSKNQFGLIEHISNKQFVYC